MPDVTQVDGKSEGQSALPFEQVRAMKISGQQAERGPIVPSRGPQLKFVQTLDGRVRPEGSQRRVATDDQHLDNTNSNSRPTASKTRSPGSM